MYQKRNKELGIMALYLGNYNKQLYLREISKLAKTPLKTTQNLLLNLEKNKILKSATIGKNKYFRLNLDNIKTKFCLLQSEIQKTGMFMDKYSPFKTFLKEIRTNTAIIAFGSFAKFTTNKNSDLDLMIISKERHQLPFHLLPYKIHETNISEDSFLKSLKKQETLIKEIEENHVILNNHSSYVNNMWNYYAR